MSTLGHKQTFRGAIGVSALPPKADMCGATSDVCFGQKADIAHLFDHLVGHVQQTKWHSEPKRFGGLEIDDQLEPGCLQDWQVSRLLAFEDSADIGADLRIDLPGNDSVADQAAGRSEAPVD